MPRNDPFLSMLPHVLGLFTGFIGPLIAYLVLRSEKDKKAIANAKHALNFQLSLLIYYLIGGILILAFIGIVVLIVTYVFAIIAGIIASLRSYEGEVYKYPLEIEFVK